MPHAWTTSRLGILVGSRFVDEDLGPGGWWLLFEPELSLDVDPDYDLVVADLAGYRQATLPRVPHAPQLRVAPDWVCEVLSPSTERIDRDEKLPFYMSAGVEVVWLVHPLERRIEVYVNEGGQPMLLATLVDGRVSRLPPFEAVALPVERLWLPRPPD